VAVGVDVGGVPVTVGVNDDVGVGVNVMVAVGVRVGVDVSSGLPSNFKRAIVVNGLFE
jgi:hypothetical protein